MKKITGPKSRGPIRKQQRRHRQHQKQRQLCKRQRPEHPKPLPTNKECSNFHQPGEMYTLYESTPSYSGDNQSPWLTESMTSTSYDHSPARCSLTWTPPPSVSPPEPGAAPPRHWTQPPQPQDISLLPPSLWLNVTDICSTSCTVTWSTYDFGTFDRYELAVTSTDEETGGVLSTNLPIDRSMREHRMDLTAGCEYEVKIAAVTFASRDGSPFVVAESKSQHFSARYSTTEMLSLYSLAHTHAYESKYAGMKPFTQFCRAKHTFRHSNGFMQPYRKDYNGHAGSLINGKLDGLFFSPLINTKHQESPFGGTRWSVAASEIYNPRLHNAYFADFYCYNTESHYVTVVICLKGSEKDQFCSTARLVPFRMDEVNPFIYFDANTNMFYSNGGLWVEIFFTEPIDLAKGTYSSITCTGRLARSKHNPDCKRCNLKRLVGGSPNAVKAPWRWRPSLALRAFTARHHAHMQRFIPCAIRHLALWF